jgi:ketosteroid isomerase-like protein
MPEENVEGLIDQVLQAVNARDVDRLMTLLDPEVEFYSRLVQVDGRFYQGHEGMRRFLAEVDEAFEGARWKLDEITRGAGDDLVVVLRQILRGRASRAPLDLPSFQAWKFRNGRPWRIVVYGTREEALEAAGVPE